ncbi:MAG: hypothetical protein ACR2PA_19410 [Hyphomicrobiaceae bacterium]
MTNNKDRSGAAKRKFSLGDVNGLLIVAAVLTGTVLMTGATEARFQAEAVEMAKNEAKMKIAHCPIGQYLKDSVVR